MRIASGEELRVVDVLLRFLSTGVVEDLWETPHEVVLVQELKQTLGEGRSAWRVGFLADGETVGLVRRVDETVTARAVSVESATSLAAGHLRKAWAHLYQHQPDVGQALDEAILALESAGRSIITPTDGAATLGKMIAAIEAKPGKWECEVGDVSAVAARLRAMWSRQPRHGVDDPNDVRAVTPELAEAAVHDALTLVHWFQTGLFRRAAGPTGG